MHTLTLEGLDTLRRDWDATKRSISESIRKAVKAGVEEGAEYARRVRRYKDRTGNLTASIRGAFGWSTYGGAYGVIVALERYASFVENGTRPHTIRPRKAGGVLRFVARDGTTVVTRKVRHPGSRAFPFMGPAYQQAERTILRVVEAGIPAAQRILSH